MREIGSEFWEKSLPAYPKKTANEAYLLSGRTALKFIIDDIRKDRKFHRVMLPSYCCESMIEPFDVSGVEVEYYHVNPDNIDYPFENDVDAVLLIDFFGYINPQNIEIACRERQKGKIVIYDSTHKIDGNSALEAYANYTFCSYRKWFYCNFAKAIKHCGEFSKAVNLKNNDNYVDIRNAAASEKEKYIAGLTEKKENFLSGFSNSEQMLDDDYYEYAGNPVLFDIQSIISKRRENATYLIEELKRIPSIKIWRENLQPADTPLFVPILLDNTIRNDLRKYLTEHSIYCPIHWPLSRYHGKSNDLYERELSLICDQRYDLSDMEQIVRTIKNYFKR